MFWPVLVLAALLASSSATKPVSPTELIAGHERPAALAQAMGKQCSRTHTELACFVYQLKVHQLASPRQRMAVDQRLSPTASFVGRYRDAARYNPLNRPPKTAAKNPPLPSRGFHSANAADVVSRLARDRQLVVINEYHMDASTRQLTLALLPRLYAEGYRYLAVEALWENGQEFAARGYAVKDSGYYTREPVFADLLSQAVKLGYKLLPYDSGGPQQLREKTQAENIYNDTFAKDPEARVLVHAGIAHINEQPVGFGLGVRPMAILLHELSGIDPLTVDQTVLRSYGLRQATPLFRALIRAYSPRVPTILLDEQSHPWSAAPGTHDISVLMPVRQPGPGRPQWLSLGGARQALPMDPAWCANKFPCEIAAWPLHQPRGGIPSDTYAMLGGGTIAQLYLRPGHYRIQAHDTDGHLLTSHGVTIEKEPQP